MSSDPRTRAGDEDRDRTATALGGHYAAGRLTLEEFQQRLDRAYAAKTLGQLDELMKDLPGSDLSPLQGQRGGRPPLPQRREPGPVQASGGRSAVRQFWLAVAITAIVIWLIGGAAGGPWLLWLAVPLAFIMLRWWSLGGSHRDRNQRHHRKGTGYELRKGRA
jgi:Flp pilus assembly protein TadB